VAALDLDGSSAEETVELITKAGGQGRAFQGDTSKAEDIDRAVTQAVAALDPLEIMVTTRVSSTATSTWTRWTRPSGAA
jgi:hypothetical protein